jgi:hypothetical protein
MDKNQNWILVLTYGVNNQCYISTNSVEQFHRWKPEGRVALIYEISVKKAQETDNHTNNLLHMTSM